MNLIEKLFRKVPNAIDIRLQLKEIERDQRKKQRDLDVMDQTKQQKVQEAVTAKKAGKQELVRDLFREMRQVEIDTGYIHNDLRRLSLAKTALTSFLRKMEMLEHQKDHKSLQNLITRFKDSSIQKAIDTAEVDDDSFNSMLEEIMGDEELAATQHKVKEDAGFANFDRAIEEIAKAEESGASEEDLSKLRGQAEKSAAADDITREPISPVFPGLEGGAARTAADASDPCKDLCVGGSASYSKIHG